MFSFFTVKKTEKSSFSKNCIIIYEEEINFSRFRLCVFVDRSNRFATKLHQIPSWRMDTMLLVSHKVASSCEWDFLSLSLYDIVWLICNFQQCQMCIKQISRELRYCGFWPVTERKKHFYQILICYFMRLLIFLQEGCCPEVSQPPNA